MPTATYPTISSGSAFRYPITRSRTQRANVTVFCDFSEQRWLKGHDLTEFALQYKSISKADKETLRLFYASQTGELLANWTLVFDGTIYTDCQFVGPFEAKNISANLWSVTLKVRVVKTAPGSISGGGGGTGTGPSGIGYIQGNGIGQMLSSITLPFLANVTAGDPFIVTVARYSPVSGFGTFGISDTLGNSYVQLVSQETGSSLYSLVYLCKASVATGADSVTFTDTVDGGSQQWTILCISEYRGVDTTTPPTFINANTATNFSSVIQFSDWRIAFTDNNNYPGGVGTPPYTGGVSLSSGVSFACTKTDANGNSSETATAGDQPNIGDQPPFTN